MERHPQAGVNDSKTSKIKQEYLGKKANGKKETTRQASSERQNRGASKNKSKIKKPKSTLQTEQNSFWQRVMGGGKNGEDKGFLYVKRWH